MSTRRTVLKHALGTSLALGMCLWASLPAAAASSASQVQANKAAAQRYIEAMGTARFAQVAKGLQAADYRLLRHEFENLKYNAMGDARLTAAMAADSAVLPDRHNTITRILGQGDVVAATYRITGTQKGNLYGLPATGKWIDVEAAAVLKFKNGKLVSSWNMASEAAVLVQLGARLPERQDGKLNPAPIYQDTRPFDDELKAWLAKPVDTPEYRHMKVLLAYKSKPENRPADYPPPAPGGRMYSVYARGGMDTLNARAKELGLTGGQGTAVTGRQDMLGDIIAEGDMAMFQFRLNAKNSGPLFNIPPSNKDVKYWEIGFARFEGDKWQEGWYLGDELGFLLMIGNKEAVDFLVGPAPAAK